MAGEALRVQALRLEELAEENQQLRQELADGGAVVRQLNESSRAQLSYQRSQIDTLEQELQQKDRDAAALRLLFDNLTQKEKTKWQRATDSLKQQLRLAEENTTSVLLRQQNYAEERQQLK